MTPIPLDWDKENADVPPEGVYLAEVTDAEEKISQNGDQYIAVKMKDAKGGGYLLQDILMLQGAGAPMGYKKLRMLGHDKDELDPQRDLVGKRVYAACSHDTYKGTTRLKVNIGAKGFTVGYRAENDPPEGKAVSAEEPTPF